MNPQETLNQILHDISKFQIKDVTFHGPSIIRQGKYFLHLGIDRKEHLYFVYQYLDRVGKSYDHHLRYLECREEVNDLAIDGKKILYTEEPLKVEELILLTHNGYEISKYITPELAEDLSKFILNKK